MAPLHNADNNNTRLEMLFEPGKVEWLAEFKPGDAVRMGQALGRHL